MTTISLIAAIDEQGGLGKNNQLLCHLPVDLKHFKTLTMGKPLLMGARTFESIGRPLPGRLNMVLSRKNLNIDGVVVFQSFSEALAHVVLAPELMVIGGAMVYQELMPMAQQIYLTKIHHQFDADVFFPEIDMQQWHCEDSLEVPRNQQNPFDVTFCRLVRHDIAR